MCVVMEEKTKIEKNTLQAFEPVEVKVVEISGQGRLCFSSLEPKADASPYQRQDLDFYGKNTL